MLTSTSFKDLTLSLQMEKETERKQKCLNIAGQENNLQQINSRAITVSNSIPPHTYI